MRPDLELAQGDPTSASLGPTPATPDVNPEAGSKPSLANALRALSRPGFAVSIGPFLRFGSMPLDAPSFTTLTDEWRAKRSRANEPSEEAFVVNVGVPTPESEPIANLDSAPAPQTEPRPRSELLGHAKTTDLEIEMEAVSTPPEIEQADGKPTEAATTRRAIIAHDIHKWFGAGRDRSPIVRGVGLSIGEGETVFLVGPSGSGKTTLLSILGCILTPDQGMVEVFGHNVTAMPREDVARFRLDNLGFIFQTFNLFPTLSALDNVQMSLAIRGVDRVESRRRAAELLDRVGLSHRLRTKPTRLSTGECQRVAIARALAGDPSILLADEPTASLDAENGQAVMEMLAKLSRETGLTLLIVTHDNRIVSFADRILRLEDGRLAGPDGGVVVPHFHQGETPSEALA